MAVAAGSRCLLRSLLFGFLARLQEALGADPSYTKALFRRGLVSMSAPPPPRSTDNMPRPTDKNAPRDRFAQAYKALQKWADAGEDLKAALGADPENKQILKELALVEGQLQEARKNRFKRFAVRSY
jgi:tetratricopeptide (TPR) repeat protein